MTWLRCLAPELPPMTRSRRGGVPRPPAAPRAAGRGKHLLEAAKEPARPPQVDLVEMPAPRAAPNAQGRGGGDRRRAGEEAAGDGIPGPPPPPHLEVLGAARVGD